MSLGRTGVIGRFKPLHNGAATMLENLCAQSEEVIIGIGSSNKYNARNPFTPTETRDMINAYLGPLYNNYTIVEIPDYGHLPGNKDGERWKQEIKEQYGILDHFITGNEYVESILEKEYDIVKAHIVSPREQHEFISGSIVREAMAKNDSWEKLVPKAIVTYMRENKLDERFRKEFGLETIMTLTDYDPLTAHHKNKEQVNVWNA